MTQADKIRTYARDKYVIRARGKHESRFSIRAGDVVRDMKLAAHRTPAVCSALKTKEFLELNALRLIAKTGPESGQSTTVTYTYEFLEQSKLDPQVAWEKLRGALKDVFATYGGGEAYLRAERVSFRDADERK